MSFALLTLTLCAGAVPPPPPPQDEIALESLEDEAQGDGDPELSSDDKPEASESPQPPPADADNVAASGPPSAATREPSGPDANPGVAPIIYDEHGDPVVPYGDPARPSEALPFAESTAPKEELPFAESSSRPSEQADLQTVDRPPRSTMSREALRRQSKVDLDKPDEANDASRQRFAVELKFGPYVPDVDGPIDSAGLGPYATIFGRTNANGVATSAPKPGVFSVISFEWQFLNFGGPLSLGTQVGYFRDKADGILAESQDGSIRSRADQVTFNVVPIAVLLGYRFELMADRWRVPFVPYARAGLAYGFWWSKDGSGEVSRNSAGEEGRGGSIGWQANLGMMLQLDFLSRASASRLDQTTGINHTYLFGEYQLSRLDGFGSGKRMSVGDDTFLLGLAIEF